MSLFLYEIVNQEFSNNHGVWVDWNYKFHKKIDEIPDTDRGIISLISDFESLKSTFNFKKNNFIIERAEYEIMIRESSDGRPIAALRNGPINSPDPISLRDDYISPAELKYIRTVQFKLNTSDFGGKLGVSGRTVEGWEQGRPINGPALKLLKMMIP